MALCKFCKQDIPRDQLFNHLNTEHNEEMKEARKRKRALKGEKGGKKEVKVLQKSEAITMDPVQAAIMEFIGERLQLPMTPALIYGYFCAKRMGFKGNVAQFLVDVIDDFFEARGINYYKEVMEWGKIGETIIQGGLGAKPSESPLASGINAK
jgi:hypothetical protein